MDAATFKQYLLRSSEAEEIYNEIKLKDIVDLHTHLDAQQLLNNSCWKDIWEAWCASDHYVWELMRRFEVPEDLITGDAPNEEKWKCFAELVPKMAGNPVYDWVHLDLLLQFGIEKEINSQTASEIWEQTKALLALPEFRPQQLLSKMRVQALCITESTFSKLDHYRILNEKLSKIKILPAWRPDELMQIDKPSWRTLLDNLMQCADLEINKLEKFLQALEKMHFYFSQFGSFTSDHAFEEPFGAPVRQNKAAIIFDSLLSGKKVEFENIKRFKAFLLFFFAELNTNSNWVMQLHIGAVRDYRVSLYNVLGKDAGGDIANHFIELVKNLQMFLNTFDKKLTIIIYVLHPSHVFTVATIARAFPNVLIGAPWWFMDSPYHIREQLLQVANVDLLAKHIGMVSDSRKLMSIQSRIDIFRRVLSDILGNMVKEGRMSLNVARQLANMVSYSNQRELFCKHIRYEQP